jgi:hypothetical protein
VLLFQGLAFGVYLVTAAAFTLMFSFSSVTNNYSAWYQVTDLFYLYAGLAAQALLAVILWQLGTLFREVNQAQAASDVIVEVTIKNWDSDAQLQARIWN